MASINKVILIGNVGAEPEVRYIGESTDATKVAQLRLATTQVYKDRNGERRENTEWHSVVAWRKLADLCENYVKKGSSLYIEGHLRTREYTDNAGVKKYVTDIAADSIQLLGPRPQQGDPYVNGARQLSQQQQAQIYPQRPSAPAQQQAAAPAPQQGSFDDFEPQDDLPF